MDPKFWLTAWEEGRTAFHSDAVHPALPLHEARFLGGGPHRVLVPLCGKTLDLAWLTARGHEVVGVELSEKAIVALHEREGRAPTVAPAGPFRAWQSPGLTVLEGDVFALTPDLAGAVDRVWDRAALVALDPERRARYVAMLRALVAPGTIVMLEAFDYDQARRAGPPHAVPEAEVRALWAGARVERLDERDGTEEMRARGWEIERFLVTTWWIELG
ncbi:MAG: methyltransferase domain-containing protein [Pseudomonadota bacterium]|nr:methyltransferase domain-containing protein [Pseudomonadota bacterium]